MQINLTRHDMRVIQCALAAVAPSGGGSHPFTVLRAITSQIGIDLSGDDNGNTLVAVMQCDAAAELPDDILRGIISVRC